MDKSARVPWVLLLAGWALVADAEPAWPVIREIAFSGNDTTQSDVLLREMTVRVGDPADPDALERSRQAIQDLRLFHSVSIEQSPLADGVQVRVAVREKYYVLPMPRASANSDGQYRYGLGVRWWNVLGLNHTLKVTVAQGTSEQPGHGSLLRYHATYDAPFLFGSPYGLGLELVHAEEPVEDVLAYDQIDDTARLVLWRAFGDGSASRGWRAGGGLHWQDQAFAGPAAVEPAGQSTALVLSTEYRDTRFDLFSEQGRQFRLEGRSTAGGLGSDYEYRQLFGSYEQSWPFGDTPHQTAGIFASGGTYRGGPGTGPAPYLLGGAESLRGYPAQFLGGDHYYYGGIEVLRPLHWNWLRGVAFIEAGEAMGGGFATPDGVFADAGIGLRLSVNWFVHTELSLGLAWPLVDGGTGRGARIYASGDR